MSQILGAGGGGSGPGVLRYLAGNSGGNVGPTAGGVINVVGSGAINIVGNAGTNTLTVSTSAAVATSYATDSGTAVPVGNVLTLHGATGITTSGAGSTVTITGSASSITITGDSGGGLTGNSFIFTGGVTGLSFAGAGSTETLGGDLNVGHGGTGNTTFTAYSVLCAGTTATGAFQNVSGLGSSGQVLTSQGAASLPHWAAASGGVTTIQGDTGSVTGATVSIKGASTAGSSVSFSGSGTAMVLNVTDANDNTIIGYQAGNTGGSYNTGLGWGALATINNTNSNVGVGAYSLHTIQSPGGSNCGFGGNTLQNLVSGNFCIAIGPSAGVNYTGSESSNIMIGHSGVASESNVTRIGYIAGTASTQTACYIDGITGVSTSGNVAVVASTGQLGTQSGVTISSAGYYNNSNTPAFNANLLNSVSNVTGNGATYTIGSTSAWATINFNIGSNFNSNGTFTAPVTGYYHFDWLVLVSPCTVATTLNTTLHTTGGDYTSQTARAAGNSNISGNGSLLVQMSSGDTAQLRATVYGEAANTDGIYGPQTYFSGYLAF